MLDFSYDVRLVLASLAVAMLAGFTGLSLLRGASELPPTRRKLMVSMAAICLGGGIWSMHFVAMLGMRLPIAFYYDSLITLISALVAILITGLALLVLHFGTRTRRRILLAGLIVGAGIPAMHYIGMSGMEICRPVYSIAGICLAIAVSIALSTAAIFLAYTRRGASNILLGTAGFGLAVFAMHFVAMWGTGFVAIEPVQAAVTWIGNDVLAFGVTLSTFILSGAFLLTGASFARPAPEAGSPAQSLGTPEVAEVGSIEVSGAAPVEPVVSAVRLPYERNGSTRFVDPSQVAALRAEGHYTILYVGDEKLFCPWSITEAAARIPADMFLRTHRSYLVNRAHVAGFERRKDSGICYFEGLQALSKVPVSRSRMPEVRAVLGV